MENVSLVLNHLMIIRIKALGLDFRSEVHLR